MSAVMPRAPAPTEESETRTPSTTPVAIVKPGWRGRTVCPYASERRFIRVRNSSAKPVKACRLRSLMMAERRR
jgi:hypothetical protein